MRLKRVQVGRTHRIEVDNSAPVDVRYLEIRYYRFAAPGARSPAQTLHRPSVPTGTSLGDGVAKRPATGPMLGINEKLCLMKHPCRAQWGVRKRPRLGSCDPPLRSRVPKVAASFLRKGPTRARRHAERLNQTQRATFGLHEQLRPFRATFLISANGCTNAGSAAN